MLRRDSGTYSFQIKAHLKLIDGMLFVYPREIPIQIPNATPDFKLETLTRPLRAQTAQGERVALAHSEMTPPGSWIEFALKVRGNVLPKKVLEEWLEYGQDRGLGQWRNASYGSFKSFSLVELDAAPEWA